MKLTVVLAFVASILFAVACGGGKDADAPAVAVKAIAPTDAPEPTSAPNPVSSQSLTPPPISMVLDTVSPELLSCVKTALGDEQYDAIITGRQDAVGEQLGLVLPCILQYQQESNAIMEMFGLDMGTIMAASTPIPNKAGQPKPSPNLQPKARGRKAVPTPTLRPMVRGQQDSSIEVTVYNPARAWHGTTLLSDHHDIDNPRVIEVNMLGEITWQYVLPEDLKQYTNPGQDIERLPNGNTLMVMPGKGIIEVTDEGEIVWSHMDEKVSHDADRLTNGNTLYSYGNNDGFEDAQAKEVTPDGELVWEWYAKNYFDKEPYRKISRSGWTHTNAVERLENGNTLVSPRNLSLLAEVDSNGSVVRTIGEGLIADAHDPESLSNGNILVSNQLKPHEALEFDPDTNKVIWRFVPPYIKMAETFSVSLGDAKQIMMPIRDVDSLPNDNVLITGYPFIIEVTRDGEIVWQLQYTDMASVAEDRLGLNEGGPSYGFYKAQRINADP